MICGRNAMPNCTCPYRAACWHGDVCGTRASITDRPGCFRPLDGSAPVVAERPPVRPMSPMTEIAEPSDKIEEDDTPSAVTPVITRSGKADIYINRFITARILLFGSFSHVSMNVGLKEVPQVDVYSP